MNYPQFNLTTIQLPAPASNMTKAEYKAAYGIDLDQIDIKAVKLVLLGNEKYPIDQIKAVEDGYEIYFNGRILSITDIVQTSDEVYDVANSKPIYYHPINMYKESDNAFIFTVLNNSPTPINTVAKVIAWANSITGTVLMNGSGLIRVEGTTYPLYAIEKVSNNVFKLFYVGNNGVASLSDNTLSNFTTVTDNVNKIN